MYHQTGADGCISRSAYRRLRRRRRADRPAVRGAVHRAAIPGRGLPRRDPRRPGRRGGPPGVHKRADRLAVQPGPGTNAGYPALVTAVTGLAFTAAGLRSIIASPETTASHVRRQASLIALLLVALGFERWRHRVDRAPGQPGRRADGQLRNRRAASPGHRPRLGTRQRPGHRHPHPRSPC